MYKIYKKSQSPRVLSYSDDAFYASCKPTIDPSTCLDLEEDKLKISWAPANMELWLGHQSGSKAPVPLRVDTYEVTIYPSESVKNTQTLPAVREDDMEKVRKNID